MVTSTGEIRVRPIARSKKRRAAAVFRRGERKTSMTWPNWSMARNRYRQVPPTFTYVSSTCHVPTCPSRLGELRGEPLDPPVDAHVVDLDASFCQELLHVPVGQTEPQVPADGKGDDLGREAIPSERRGGRRSGTKVTSRSHDASVPAEAATRNATVP